MSDEEKKAMIELNHFSNMTAYWKQEEYTNSEIDNYIKLILNLIEKQQKEIKAINSMQKYRIEVIDERELISKDKIKAKIEELLDRFDLEEELQESYDDLLGSESAIKILKLLYKELLEKE